MSRRSWSAWFAGAFAVVAAVSAVWWALIRFVLPHYLWHPLTGLGYQFWSGLGSDFGELTLVSGVISANLMLYHHFNCHADGCWRLAWHVHDDHGHPVCKKHHPHAGGCPHTIGGVAHDCVRTPVAASRTARKRTG